MIRVLTPNMMMPVVCSAVGAGSDRADLLAQALRRASALLAPASRSDLVRFVFEPLGDLGFDRDDIEEALEALISYGDILDMRRLDSDPWDAPDHVLRPAPPAFVHRANGDFIILGVAGDLPSALTPDLDARVAVTSGVRTLRPVSGERLEGHLRLLGLVKLSEQAWLRLPDREDAAAYVARWVDRLQPVAAGGLSSDEIQILDPVRNVRFYRGRWTSPDHRTDGVQVARRPRLYGAPLWCLLEFAQGRAVRWLDFSGYDDRQRPYDLAWRVQAAIDATRGVPQEVAITPIDGRTRFDFFSPLPGFAERRLALVGDKQPGARSLFGYVLDDQNADREVKALEDLLWMRAVNREDER